MNYNPINLRYRLSDPTKSNLHTATEMMKISHLKYYLRAGFVRRDFLLGSDVKVGISSLHGDDSLVFKTLEEVQPYHWSYSYKNEELFD